MKWFVEWNDNEILKWNVFDKELWKVKVMKLKWNVWWKEFYYQKSLKLIEFLFQNDFYLYCKTRTLFISKRSFSSSQPDCPTKAYSIPW